MFGFVTHTVNPIAGGWAEIINPDTLKTVEIKACAYDCVYCWAKAMINRNMKTFANKYTGEYRVHKKALRKYPPGSIVFVQTMTDIGYRGIPRKVIEEVLEWTCTQPEVTWLFLTKSDTFYDEYIDQLPPNMITGFTIETNRNIPYLTSKAPSTTKRLSAAKRIKRAMKGRTQSNFKLFICIEPIMDFDYTAFLLILVNLKPHLIAIGYDNYKNNLPEPDSEKIYRFIFALKAHKIEVHEKTIDKP